jgi:PAS domain S-box-containing protein
MPKDFKRLVELTEKLIQIENDRDKKSKDLELLIEETSDGYWDWHIPSNYEYMSPKFWTILGQDPNTKRHSPDERMKHIHPDDLKTTKKSMEDHFKSKGVSPYIQEVRYLKPDGSIVWILCKGKVIEWDGDEPIRMVGIHFDITYLKGE